jgi:hypothetical protein
MWLRNFENLFLEAAHGMKKIIKNLPGGAVDRPLDYLFLEKGLGHLAHQADAEGITGADAVNFRKLPGGSFQDAPEELKALDGLFGRFLAITVGGARGKKKLHDLIVVETRKAGFYELLPEPLTVAGRSALCRHNYLPG